MCAFLPTVNTFPDSINPAIKDVKVPYHMTDTYKRNVQKRLARVLEDRGELYSHEVVSDLIHRYDAPATQHDRENIVRSIEQDAIIPFDPSQLMMFNHETLFPGMASAIESAGENHDPYFLYLGSAKDIGLDQKKGWTERIGDKELDIAQYKEDHILQPGSLTDKEKNNYMRDPYKIFMKIQYVGQDTQETLPMSANTNTRQGRKKYDVSFVVLENTSNLPGYTFTASWFDTHKKTMNYQEFTSWFYEKKPYLIIPRSLSY